jgi:outer membrane biosynthesis protein TonB
MPRPVHVLAPLVLAAFAANGHAQDAVRGALTSEVVDAGDVPQPDPSVAAGVAAGKSVDDADVAPQRLVTVLPRYPRDAPRGTAGTISVTLNVDAAGRPFNVQPAPEHDSIGLRDVDGTLAAALEPGPAFRAAVVDAVSQWVYAPPMREGTTVLARIAFLAGGRVRLVTHRVVQPVQTTSTVSSAPR